MLPTLPPQLIDWLEQRRVGHFHRQLLVLSGPEDWAMATCESILPLLKGERVLWAGIEANPDKITVPIAGYRQFLGQEFDHLVYNGFAGTRANALMALSGVVKRSGLMILLCPDFDLWPDYHHQHPALTLSFGYQTHHAKGAFIPHLCQVLSQREHVALCTPTSFKGSLAPAPTVSMDFCPPFRSEQQQHAVSAIGKVATGHRNRPLVLTADRGRGKSSALGISAAQLIQAGKQRIIVSGPSPGAVQQVFTTAACLLPLAKKHNLKLSLASAEIVYIPPDALIREPHQADLLMIDEAAAIPVPVLQKLTSQYSRIVFASTVHGYEGSGRGFETRFKGYLQQHCPGFTQQHMTTPIRWLEDDSLEQDWFDMLLMERLSTSNEVTRPVEVSLAEVHTRLVSKQQLIADKVLMAAVFNLLVNAHYQTMPDDFMRLLDAEDMGLYVANNNSQVLGVILACDEGGVALSPVVADICSGKRRVAGHLCAQGLSFTYGQAGFARLNTVRIVRIATQPGYQSLGIGSIMLAQFEELLTAAGIDAITSSFGVNLRLASFWQNAGYLPLKLGKKQDASSGECSLIIGKALQDQARTLMKGVLPEYNSDIICDAPDCWRTMDARLMARLFHWAANTEGSLTGREQTMLAQVASGWRQPDSCHYLLLRLATTTPLGSLAKLDDLALLFAYVVQKKSKTQICEEFGFTGKKQLTRALRQCCERLLPRGLDNPPGQQA